MVFTHATRVRVPDGELIFCLAPFFYKVIPVPLNGCGVWGMSAVSRLAQLVERKTLNLVVVGSSPTVGAPFFSKKK